MHSTQIIASDDNEASNKASKQLKASMCRKPGQFSLKNPWKAHTRKIFLASSLIVVPMVLFTITICWIVFAHRLDQAGCPYLELCPGSDLVNITSPAYYYVDFSATQLAFISSWSSTVSFALISAFMTIFGYSVAKTLLNSSKTSPVKPNTLPTPYQLSMMTRVLNADILSLWELGLQKVRRVFWNKESSYSSSPDYKTPITLQTGISMFFVCVVCSILIQAADTYLHITTKAVNLIETGPLSSSNFDYSRSLGQWCLNRSATGSQDNVHFWGCGITFDIKMRYAGIANRSALSAINREAPGRHHIFEYQDDKDALQYAIIGPAAVESDIDWKASSFAVSTQCSPIPAAACNVGHRSKGGNTRWPFNCSSKLGGIDFEGYFTRVVSEQHSFDTHRYLHEDQPFDGESPIGWDDAIKKYAPNITANEVNSTFSNPWHWMGAIYLTHSKSTDEFEQIRWGEDPHVMSENTKTTSWLLLHCNTTVWDVTYTTMNGRVTSIERQKSNGSVAGIVSLPALRTFGFSRSRFSEIVEESIWMGSPTLREFIKVYSLGASKEWVRPLAAQTINQPALLVQKRNSRLITQLPVASLWLLVSANLFYAGLGLGFAGWALFITSPSVHQVHTRLSIAGLVAELFERPFSTRAVKSDSDLFEDKGQDGKNVGVRVTSAGGSEFFLKE